MTAFVLYVFLNGMAPQEAGPTRYSTFAECEHQRRLVWEPTKTSTTVYKCLEEQFGEDHR